MNEKVKRVMEYIHGIAYRELQGDQYIEFLECIEVRDRQGTGRRRLAGT